MAAVNIQILYVKNKCTVQVFNLYELLFEDRTVDHKRPHVFLMPQVSYSRPMITSIFVLKK